MLVYPTSNYSYSTLFIFTLKFICPALNFFLFEIKIYLPTFKLIWLTRFICPTLNFIHPTHSIICSSMNFSWLALSFIGFTLRLICPTPNFKRSTFSTFRFSCLTLRFSYPNLNFYSYTRTYLFIRHLNFSYPTLNFLCS